MFLAILGGCPAVVLEKTIRLEDYTMKITDGKVKLRLVLGFALGALTVFVIKRPLSIGDGSFFLSLSMPLVWIIGLAFAVSHIFFGFAFGMGFHQSLLNRHEEIHEKNFQNFYFRALIGFWPSKKGLVKSFSLPRCPISILWIYFSIHFIVDNLPNFSTKTPTLFFCIALILMFIGYSWGFFRAENNYWKPRKFPLNDAGR